MGGAYLALGIIAIVTALYFIALGVLNIVIGDSFSAVMRKVFEINLP